MLADLNTSEAPPVWLLFGFSAVAVVQAFRFRKTMRWNPLISDRVRPFAQVMFLFGCVVFAFVFTTLGIALLVAG